MQLYYHQACSLGIDKGRCTQILGTVKLLPESSISVQSMALDYSVTLKYNLDLCKADTR